MRNDLQSLLKGPQMNKWTMGKEIRVIVTRGLDVPNFLKNVPRVPKSILE